MHFGIDYGSKLAGTTVITYNIEKTLFQICSHKKEDADAMIIQAVKKLDPSSIYIDAPLSLPKAYFGKGENFFYRKSDIDLKAMSPMFLGGLTARAMKLKATLEVLGIDVHETYPAALVRSIPELKARYSKKDKSTIASVMDHMDVLLKNHKIPEKPDTMHKLDSILAWYSGLRHTTGIYRAVGEREEGVIIY